MAQHLQHVVPLFTGCLLLSACFSSTPRYEHTGESSEQTAQTDQTPTDPPDQTEDTGRRWQPTYHREQSDPDGPEISTSTGETGGVIVMWPRIVGNAVPDDTSLLAADLQDEVVRFVSRAFPGRPVDVRPEPERVCPQAGCDAIVVGVLLAREEWGCAAVALISAPGRSSQRLVPWYGYVELESYSVEFREPPENVVLVRDFGYCDEIVDRLHEGDPAVEEALRDVVQ